MPTKAGPTEADLPDADHGPADRARAELISADLSLADLAESGPLPPGPVRASFALFLGVVMLSALNAVVQVAFAPTGVAAAVGAVIETALFLVLAVPMHAGRLWARFALTSAAWVFIAVSLLALVGLGGTPAHLHGMVLFTVGYVSTKLVMILAATALMYRPNTRDYFH